MVVPRFLRQVFCCFPHTTTHQSSNETMYVFIIYSECGFVICTAFPTTLFFSLGNFILKMTPVFTFKSRRFHWILLLFCTHHRQQPKKQYHDMNIHWCKSTYLFSVCLHITHLYFSLFLLVCLTFIENSESKWSVLPFTILYHAL